MLRRLFALIVLAVLVAFGVAYWRARSVGQEPKTLREVGEQLKDTAITAAVKAAYGLNRSLRPYSIGVQTQAAVVTLSGQVPRQDIKDLALRVAASVPDVQRVVNGIALGEPPAAADGKDRSLGESLSDEALEMQVRLAFSLNRHLKGTDIGVRSYKREVELTGEVSSEEQRKLALEIARDTNGVGGVRESIRLRGQSVKPQDPRAAAENAIKSNPNLAPYPIAVREENGRLILAGSVRTAAEKDLAGLLAQGAAGTSVENTLEIKP